MLDGPESFFETYTLVNQCFDPDSSIFGCGMAQPPGSRVVASLSNNAGLFCPEVITATYTSGSPSFDPDSSIFGCGMAMASS